MLPTCCSSSWSVFQNALIVARPTDSIMSPSPSKPPSPTLTDQVSLPTSLEFLDAMKCLSKERYREVLDLLQLMDSLSKHESRGTGPHSWLVWNETRFGNWMEAVRALVDEAQLHQNLWNQYHENFASMLTFYENAHHIGEKAEHVNMLKHLAEYARQIGSSSTENVAFVTEDFLKSGHQRCQAIIVMQVMIVFPDLAAVVKVFFIFGGVNV